MAVAAMVLGILSVVLNILLGWIPVIGQIICMILGILAIILGVTGMKKQPEKKGMAVAGLVLGIIGTVWGTIALIACVGALGAGAMLFDEAIREIENM
jgi:hypothetical protein